MEQLITIDKGALDVLIRQVSELTAALKNRALEDIYGQILDSDAAARYLKVSGRYLQILRETGKIRYSQDGRVTRFRKFDLDKWMDEYRVGR